jgi:hypothetical protein
MKKIRVEQNSWFPNTGDLVKNQIVELNSWCPGTGDLVKTVKLFDIISRTLNFVFIQKIPFWIPSVFAGGGGGDTSTTQSR